MFVIRHACVDATNLKLSAHKNPHYKNHHDLPSDAPAFTDGVSPQEIGETPKFSLRIGNGRSLRSQGRGRRFAAGKGNRLLQRREEERKEEVTTSASSLT